MFFTSFFVFLVICFDWFHPAAGAGDSIAYCAEYVDIAENNSFGINCCAEEGGSHRSHVADRRRIVYHYPWGSYRVDFQRRSGVFQQRAVFESFGCQS